MARVVAGAKGGGVDEISADRSVKIRKKDDHRGNDVAKNDDDDDDDDGGSRSRRWR